MAGNYSQLKSDLQAVVKENHEEYITGQRLQNQLIAMINSLGTGYQYMGIATPTTNPGTPDEKVFYIASTAGTYSNFGSPALVVNDGEVVVFKWDTAWHKEVTGAATAAQVTELGQEVGVIAKENDVVVPITSEGSFSNIWIYESNAGKHIKLEVTNLSAGLDVNKIQIITDYVGGGSDTNWIPSSGVFERTSLSDISKIIIRNRNANESVGSISFVITSSYILDFQNRISVNENDIAGIEHNMTRLYIDGLGSSAIIRDVFLLKGNKYRIYLPTSWDWSATSGTAAVFAVDRYYNGASAGNIVVVRANETGTKGYYDIDATDNDFYRITIRANQGIQVRFSIDNITPDVELNEKIESISNVRFSLVGKGNANVIKDVHLFKGCSYNIFLPTNWNTTSLTGSVVMFAIDRYLNNANVENIVIVRANNPTTKGIYSIKATDNDYYRITIRADVDVKVDFEIENSTATTNLEDSIKEKEKVFRELDMKGQVLNDAFVYTAFSAPHLNIEPTKGIGYVTGLASKTVYTEAGGDLILAVFPCLQPYRLEYYSVAKTGDVDVDGHPLSGTPYDMCSMSFYNNDDELIIRSFFVDYNGYNLYYRDFNTETKSFISAPVKVQYYNANNELADVTDVAMSAWVSAQGGAWAGPQKTIFTNHIINDKTLWNDGDYIYSVLTAAGPGNPIVVKSDDNFATIHLVAMLPKANAMAETAIAKLNGIVYILYRCNDGYIWFQTTQDFVTYTEAVAIQNSSTQRPEILVFKNNIYLCVPMKYEDRYISDNRVCYKVLKGTGSDLSAYSIELELVDKFGLVYMSAQFFNGRFLECHSNNCLMFNNNGSGKATMKFNIIPNYYQ